MKIIMPVIIKIIHILTGLFLCMTLVSCDLIEKWLASKGKAGEKSTSDLSSSETSEEENKQEQSVGEKSMSASVEFLNQNKNKEGVKTTASGLQYKVIKEGTGKSPQATSLVEVHYRGTLIDGTEFDSSYKRNETAKFPLDQVIPGWTEGLQLMKEGATYEFYIPSALAYGDRRLPNIPAGSTLIFKVELIKVL